MNLAGSLYIELQLQQQTISELEIRSTRPRSAGRLFRGRPIGQVVRQLPLLFSLCGLAQQIAALTAAEQALGYEATASLRQARMQLLLAEQGREQLLRLWRDWLSMDGLSHDSDGQAALLGFNRFYARLLVSHKPALQLAPAAFELPPLPPQEPLPPLLQVSIHQRLERLHAGQPEDALDHCLQHLQQRFAQLQLQPGCAALPELSAAELQPRLDADFCAAPQWQGCCFETGLIDQNIILNDQNMTDNLHPLTCRFLNLIYQLQNLPARLQAEILNTTPAILPAGHGLAQIPSARGRLIHSLVLEEEQVVDYQILAPTEWNFHPQGTLRQQLLGVKVRDAEQAQALAHRLTLLIDPCVGFSVEVVEHA